MQLLGAAGGFVFVAELLKLTADGFLSMPGIAELDPASPFMAALNKPFFTPVRTYRMIAANYEPAASDLKMAVLDGAADAMFAGAANDLVVPFKGAQTFDPAVAAGVNCGVLFRFGDAQNPQSKVCHTNFFRQCATRDLLLGLSEM
jgi:hypothetical protein